MRDGDVGVTTQIIFPYMSDAHAPGMDIRMSPQDTAMALSFWQNVCFGLGWRSDVCVSAVCVSAVLCLVCLPLRVRPRVCPVPELRFVCVRILGLS